jgi:hypothetical protein
MGWSKTSRYHDKHSAYWLFPHLSPIVHPPPQAQSKANVATGQGQPEQSYLFQRRAISAASHQLPLTTAVLLS